MNREEVERAGVLERVVRGEITLAAATERLKVCYRQAKRLLRQYRLSGLDGLRHGNVGRRSNRAKDAEFRNRVVSVVAEHYGGEAGSRLGPTLAAEHLADEHGLVVDSETLRRWMLEAGLWAPRRKRKGYRSRRLRKAHFGELLQMDGSFHRWLEQRAGQRCLINLVDDATGIALAAFSKEETTWAVADVLRAWVECYGIPRAIYTDWKNVYHGQPDPDGNPSTSQFGQMCARLGIDLIAANSPQAKGRVERHHGTHQDRLVKKLRIAGIADYESAHTFLESYLEQHNARYGRKPDSDVDFHDPLPDHLDLNDVFCLQSERTVGTDWIVQYQRQLLQIERNAGVPAKSKIVVLEHRDASLHLIHNGREIPWRPVEHRIKPETPLKVGMRRPHVNQPAPTHPWKRFPATAPVSPAQVSPQLSRGKGAQSPPLAPAPPSPANTY